VCNSQNRLKISIKVLAQEMKKIYLLMITGMKRERGEESIKSERVIMFDVLLTWANVKFIYCDLTFYLPFTSTSNHCLCFVETTVGACILN
jgi:hypothetical protein